MGARLGAEGVEAISSFREDTYTGLEFLELATLWSYRHDQPLYHTLSDASVLVMSLSIEESVRPFIDLNEATPLTDVLHILEFGSVINMLVNMTVDVLRCEHKDLHEHIRGYFGIRGFVLNLDTKE